MKTVLNKVVVFLGIIIVSASAWGSVTKNDRVLVVVSELQEHGPQNLRTLYVALEELTQVQTNLILGDDYKQIIYLRSNQATLANFASTLRSLAMRQDVVAIDVIMSLHGSDGRLYFREGRVNVSAMTAAVTAGSTPLERLVVRRMKAKLRTIYNLSCFGRSHNVAFRDMGFDITVGSNGINANSEIEYVTVLTSWSFGVPFMASFRATNSDAAIALADAPVQIVGINADSKKYFRGDSLVKINSDAQ